ncbi:tRNA (adenosine(37)-N6)-threonylcarbamoyltransferase complex dimerization subunit type 1 TsaB [Alicyclobacillus tolerans]|uniref:tRNA (adenosine(37)-N6)-threonylcarbamoyltransferase complex dimerization subunit type 1 TsaB n=1 Tax=Alicyclobacillus tolerans TaxID=90970 RepID=UPI003B778575
MAILVMDTATEVLATGLIVEENILVSAVSSTPRGHSTALAPLLQSILQSGRTTPHQLKKIVVGVGPGSYTGVRMAVSMAKSMAMALEIPLLPVSTLTALAYAAVPLIDKGPFLLLPLLYARRGRAFGALYQGGGDGLEVLAPESVQPISEWSSLATRAVQDRQNQVKLVMIHDFPDAQADEIPQFATSIHLKSNQERLPRGLWLASQTVRPMMREEIHEVLPNYMLEVEAQVRLRERGAARFGNGLES